MALKTEGIVDGGMQASIAIRSAGCVWMPSTASLLILETQKSHVNWLTHFSRTHAYTRPATTPSRRNRASTFREKAILMQHVRLPRNGRPSGHEIPKRSVTQAKLHRHVGLIG
jgi:hypothetical protein